MLSLPRMQEYPVPGILLAAIFLSVLFPVPAAAHPPSSVTPFYHQDTSTLDVAIVHTVRGNPDHYIQEIAISVNGRVTARSEYTSQPADTFTVPYQLDLNPGDQVEVTASCSITGSGTGTFVMPGPTEPAREGTVPAAAPAQQSSPSPLLLSAGAAIAVLLQRKR